MPDAAYIAAVAALIQALAGLLAVLLRKQR